MDTDLMDAGSGSSTGSYLLNGVITVLMRGGTIVAGVAAIAIGELDVWRERPRRSCTLQP